MKLTDLIWNNHFQLQSTNRQLYPKYYVWYFTESKGALNHPETSYPKQPWKQKIDPLNNIGLLNARLFHTFSFVYLALIPICCGENRFVWKSGTQNFVVSHHFPQRLNHLFQHTQVSSGYIFHYLLAGYKMLSLWLFNIAMENHHS
jgi:hypothetical protein